MSLVDVKPYMRTVLDGLGFKEWTDGFNVENIPSSILDGSYHLQVGTINGGAANQRAHRFDFGLTVRVFFKGFNNPASAIDEALGEGDNILASALLPSTRYINMAIKDVIPVSITVDPLEASNDNSVVLTMEFNFNLYECY